MFLKSDDIAFKEEGSGDLLINIPNLPKPIKPYVLKPIS